MSSLSFEISKENKITHFLGPIDWENVVKVKTEDHGKINNSWYPQRHNAIFFQWILHALSIWNRNDVAISRAKYILTLISFIYLQKQNESLNFNT